MILSNNRKAFLWVVRILLKDPKNIIVSKNGKRPVSYSTRIVRYLN